MGKVAEKPSCSIRVLPPELVAHAARIATDVNPLNRPAVQMFAATFPGDETDIVPPQYIAALTTKYWGSQPRVLPTQFLDTPDAETRRLILEHLNAWRCGITFVESETLGKVRITRGGSGYWSYLGTDILLIPPDQPTMCLQSFTARTAAAEYLRVVPHEGGHTLGFPHEHMRRDLVARLDREKTVAYFGRTQGWSRREVEAQVLTPLDESTLMQTPVDQTSAMCYQLPGEITTDGRPIPGGARPNPSDLEFARAIYPLGGPPTPPVTPPTEPPPVEPPVEPPKPPEPGIPLQVGVASKDHPYDPAAGPTLFRCDIARQGTYSAGVQGPGLWLVAFSRSPTPSPDDAYYAPAKVNYALEPGPIYLRIRHRAAQRPGIFRVKIARAR